MSTLYLHGIGHFHPENIITNQFLQDLDIGTNEEWILERVGILTRHTLLPLEYIKETKNRDPKAAFGASLYSNAQMGAAAARMALDRAGIKAEDIGLLISGSSSTEHISPAEASIVASELGIEVPCFDLCSSCTTFGMQINFLNSMRPDALPPFVLIVTTEGLTRRVDYSDKKSAVLFGDGSSAAVVSATVPARASFTSCYYDTKPSEWEKVGISSAGYFYQDGNAVQGFAIRKTTESIRLLQKHYSLNGDRFIFIGHQANMGMLQTVCERCAITEDNHWHNVEYFGNTGCSGAPSTLSQHWNDLQPGDNVAFSIVGAGLSWVHMILEMEDAC
jgi:3-oxoacyl-[acyl-carrier-protein] synthase-3